jgi:alkanesulfonate monooxygenase SsuD/methylene tetrahydromethanopterin reductase-like flavin-dependent oxidoreductase (luciferase family)
VKFSYFHLMPYTDLAMEDYTGANAPGWPFTNRDQDPHKVQQMYRTYVDDMVHAESCGFDWVGCNEHHYTPYGMMANPNIIGGALAYRTSRARIAMIGNIIPINNPVRVAEEYAMLDCMSGGRLMAGFMRGIPHEYIAYNLPPSESWERQREAIALYGICPFMGQGQFMGNR